MIGVLIRKLLRDLRVPLLVVCLLLAAFQFLWVKVTERITGQLIPAFATHVPVEFIKQMFFQGPGKIVETLMGGELVNIERPQDMLSVGYVHPLVLTIFCIWAVGRASSALTGEIDRGTVELLLSQPVARNRVIFAHFCVDGCTIPVLCLSLWAGTWLGTWAFGLLQLGAPLDTGEFQVDPRAYAPALVNVAALLFAISGYTMWLSAAGRFRARVMGIAIVATLLQLVVNVIGQMWDALARLRPFTVFYYYQPQRIILKGEWSVDLSECWKMGQHGPMINVIWLLLTVGLIGYGMALWTFGRRDIPAPL
jgi:ABC-2 type transport system permease protein